MRNVNLGSRHSPLDTLQRLVERKIGFGGEFRAPRLLERCSGDTTKEFLGTKMAE